MSTKHSLAPLSIKNFTEFRFKLPKPDNNIVPTPFAGISSFSWGPRSESSIACVSTPFISFFLVLTSTNVSPNSYSTDSSFVIFRPTARSSDSPSSFVDSLALTVRVSDFPCFPVVYSLGDSRAPYDQRWDGNSKNTHSLPTALGTHVLLICVFVLHPIPWVLDLSLLVH